jgi:BlaI family transcriptional regulator, penicillinase repressor
MEEKKKYQPTESELDILQVLWQKGSATVREIHDVLEKQRDIGYTTTLKTMQIMTEKQLLDRDTTTRTHVYSPRISQENTQKQFLSKMKNDLFNGSASRMVIGALNHGSLSTQEIDEIREYLKQFEK